MRQEKPCITFLYLFRLQNKICLYKKKRIYAAPAVKGLMNTLIDRRIVICQLIQVDIVGYSMTSYSQLHRYFRILLEMIVYENSLLFRMHGFKLHYFDIKGLWSYIVYLSILTKMWIRFNINFIWARNVLNIKKYIIVQAKYWVVSFRELGRQIGSYFHPVARVAPAYTVRPMPGNRAHRPATVWYMYVTLAMAWRI